LAKEDLSAKRVQKNLSAKEDLLAKRVQKNLSDKEEFTQVNPCQEYVKKTSRPREFRKN